MYIYFKSGLLLKSYNFIKFIIFGLMRTFISINLDRATREKISAIQDEVKDKISALNKNFLESIRWTPKEKFHLTLFFIGEVNESKLKEISSCLSFPQSDPALNVINLSLKKINAFPRLRYPRVLIVDLLNKDGRINKLYDKIYDCMQKNGFEDDKTFYPHITLGRIKREHKINLTGIENTIKTDLNFSVKEFQLMESKLRSSGAEYLVINKYKL